MNSHEIDALISALGSNRAHLENASTTRKMYCFDSLRNEWEVWGQTKEHGRTHCIERGKFEDCLKALIGEKGE